MSLSKTDILSALTHAAKSNRFQLSNVGVSSNRMPRILSLCKSIRHSAEGIARDIPKIAPRITPRVGRMLSSFQTTSACKKHEKNELFSYGVL